MASRSILSQVPIFTLLFLGYLLLNESIDISFMVGATLIFGGIIVSIIDGQKDKSS
ncbi:hypothetical protein [Desulfosporosinus orientis]|uniref:hypothetical protein n=1 Tax=Desulfosporosinus orientis TaxID=1563 RepID=UPI00130541A3|nr:hypothetical protein [Desulfosporosinus orientis]